LSLFFWVSCGEWRAVIVPVADLRTIPELLPLSYELNAHEDSQVLWGDCINVIASNGSDWLQVQVSAQYKLVNGSFVPYPGFIQTMQTTPLKGNYSCNNSESFNLVTNSVEVPIYKKTCEPIGCLGNDLIAFLSIGTRLQQASIQSVTSDWISINLPTGGVGWVARSHINFYVAANKVPQSRISDIIALAHQFVGWIYFGGGRSAWNVRSVGQLTGVDCSGLTGLVYQTNGVIIPRDSGGQYFASRHGPKIPVTDGGLFFFAWAANDTVHHVMLNAGNGYIIESHSSDDGTENSTRYYPIQDRFGVPVEKLVYGMKVDADSVLYWGDYLL